MQSPTTDWRALFKARPLQELIPYLGRVFNGTTFNEFGAAYERMLEIAFHDPTTPNDDRASAASWANVLDSLIVLTLAGREEMLVLYSKARNSSMTHATRNGYGSLAFVALHDSGNLLNRVWSEEGMTEERQSIEERRAFLLSVAFGRASDAPTNLD